MRTRDVDTLDNSPLCGRYQGFLQRVKASLKAWKRTGGIKLAINFCLLEYNTCKIQTPCTTYGRKAPTKSKSSHSSFFLLPSPAGGWFTRVFYWRDEIHQRVLTTFSVDLCLVSRTILICWKQQPSFLHRTCLVQFGEYLVRRRCFQKRKVLSLPLWE